MRGLPSCLEIDLIRDRLHLLEFIERLIGIRPRQIAEASKPASYRRRATAKATRNARRAAGLG
jgi:hypothetical protein